MISHIYKSLHKRPRSQKRIILLLVDGVILVSAIAIAFVLRLNYFLPVINGDFVLLSLVSTLFGLSIFWFLGLYRAVLRAVDLGLIRIIFFGSVLAGLAMAASTLFFPNVFMPRSVPVIYAILVFIFVGLSRALARAYYDYAASLNVETVPVLVFGAGDSGSQLAGILGGSAEFKVVGFVDDDTSLTGNTLRGKPIYKPDEVVKIAKKYEKVRVFLSVQNLTSDRKREIYKFFSEHGIQIDVVPALQDVIAGRASVQEARAIRLEDLLGRDVVPPVKHLFDDVIENSSFLITGGGGSIGAELCRQLITNKPKKLIILDSNEHALYQIEQELTGKGRHLSVSPILEFHLGDAGNPDLIERLIKTANPDYLFHAAAFKHVPLVEKNSAEGVRNNILSTLTVAEACQKHGVRRMTLVSSDKAVRPTNIMGATKRVAELIVQSMAEKSDTTVFSMVRFGNVLGSSGSVIPLFRKQIEAGGPVTVTHPEVSRYFMLIPEAAQLVIQASFMAEGGEVFLLEMGEPIKIVDLAKLTITLSGKSINDEENPDGEIIVDYIGLRPGEKMYEEVLIGEEASKTNHPKIYKARENYIPLTELKRSISELQAAAQAGDDTEIRRSLGKIVEGFESA